MYYKQATARGVPICTFLSVKPEARTSRWHMTVPAVSVRSSNRSAPDAAVDTSVRLGGAPSKAAACMHVCGVVLCMHVCMSERGIGEK